MWIALNPGFQFDKSDEGKYACDICGTPGKAGESGVWVRNSKTEETILVVSHGDGLLHNTQVQST